MKAWKSPLRTRTLLLTLLGFIAACVTVSVPFEREPYHRIAVVQDADEFIGGEECTVCHEEVGGHATIATYHEDCESCHGPGILHEDSEAPLDIRYPGSGDCLACHESGRDTHLTWGTGEHERAGVLCSDCHDPHNREPHNLRVAKQVNFPFAAPSSQLCVSCHVEIASRLSLPSHHPVREGMLDCVDCHAPHGDRRTQLGGRTALCSSCHQDHVGPWIYEHPPVAEDCMMCHNPHGTAATNLLDTNQPAVCLSCHTTPDSIHRQGLAPDDLFTPAVSQTFYTRCTDCHAAIHGSYQDVHLRR